MHMLSDTPVNCDIFLKFLKSLNLPATSILLMHNIAFHKRANVRDFLESKEWEVLSTPPYSPWFNPIEDIFSVVKHTYRVINAHQLAHTASTTSSRHEANS